MIEVKDLLVKFSKALLSEEAKRESVRRAVSEVLRTEIAPEKIKISGDTVYLDIKPLYKNELFLKQEQIQKKLASLLLDQAPPKYMR